MHFHEIEVENYKCFKDKVSLKLEKGVNIIVGKNNVGKTALLEALSLQFPNRPYLSIETFPKANREPQESSNVSITFTIEKEELIDLLLVAKRGGNSDFRLPLHKDGDWDIEIVAKVDEGRKFDTAMNNAKAKTFAEKFFRFDNYTFKLQREALSNNDGAWYALDDTYISPKFSRAEGNKGDVQHYINFQVDSRSRVIEYKDKIITSGNGKRHREDFLIRLANGIDRFIYKFRAERIPSESCKLGQDNKLKSDSSNLAEVLNLLQSQLSTFKELNKLIKEIMPNIYQIGVLPYQATNETYGQVAVWNSKNTTDQKHLAFTLDQVGSGVGQVIAILYVLLTASEPQIILIDEPQSFLHPDALRKLTEVLSYYGQKHQIVIATHTPTVINAVEPSTLTLVKQKRSKSVLQKIDIKSVKHQRIYLGEIGARLSDVFGYDRVIWVEGLTEEICFPKIIRKFSKKPLIQGTTILQVRSTGDFDNKDEKDVDRIVDIYERLSLAEGGLAPEAVAYIFDKETRSDKDIENKQKKYPTIHFTGKRLYENYLLNAEAITSVINEIEKNKKAKLQEVVEWIEEKKKLKKYYQPFEVPKDLKTWTQTIHGKRLLKDLFKEFCSSQKNQNFKEKEHSVLLSEWLLENSKEDLKEIAVIIEGAMKK